VPLRECGGAEIEAVELCELVKRDLLLDFRRARPMYGPLEEAAAADAVLVWSTSASRWPRRGQAWESASAL